MYNWAELREKNKTCVYFVHMYVREKERENAKKERKSESARETKIEEQRKTNPYLL